MTKNSITSICALIANDTLLTISGAELREEITSWVTLICTIAITVTTIGIQIYHLIRDRNEDKKKNKPADTSNKKENDKKNG